jgi:hypothetical protein
MPDSPPSFAFSPLVLALQAVAMALATAFGSFITYLLTKKSQSANIHKIEAETVKTEAESRQIDSAIITNAYKRLDELEVMNRGQGLEITALKQSILGWEFDGRNKDSKIKTLEAANDLLERQVQKARAAGMLEDREPHSPNPAAT